MSLTWNALGAALILTAGLSACAGDSSTYATGERSGSYGGRTMADEDRGPQARNASPYMRQ